MRANKAAAALARRVHASSPMWTNIIVMPGSARIGLKLLRSAAREFGCNIAVAGGLREAMGMSGGGTVAVIFHRDALSVDCSWTDTIGRLKVALPGIKLIACYGYSEPIDWPALSDAGAFHALGFPLKAEEVRQSLGFLFEAEQRLKAAPEKPAPKLEPARTQAQQRKAMKRAAS